MINEVDSTRLKQRLLDEDAPLLLDIRSSAELTRGVLPKAEHLPMHTLPLRINEIPKNRELVLYCHSGNRSYHACNYLIQNGFNEVTHLRGGIVDWVRSGFQMELFTP